jgi:hypothetical protein
VSFSASTAIVIAAGSASYAMILVAPTNSFAPPFAHFGYRLAPDKAAEFGKEAPIMADG